MRSIASRLVLFYVLGSALTVAIMFAAGYGVLHMELMRGLDQLVEAESQRMVQHLRDGQVALTPQLLERRLRRRSAASGELYLVEVRDNAGLPVFSSTDLRGDHIEGGARTGAYDTQAGAHVRVRAYGRKLKGGETLTVATSLEPASRSTNLYVLVCGALFGIIVVANLVLAKVFSDILLRPLLMIRETTLKIGSNNLDQRIDLRSREDEFGDLARAINQMFDRLESSFKQIRRFTADASHELKTPLSLIRLQTEKLLCSGDLSPDHEERLRSQMEDISRLTAIIDDLLLLSRADSFVLPLRLESRSPEAFLKGLEMDIAVLAEAAGVQFSATHQGEGLAVFEAKWIRQVLLNLFSNAFRVTPPGGAVSLTSTLTRQAWQVSIEDTGPGLSAADRERVFERFVQVGRDASRTGTGLGLAICRSIITLHGGEISAAAASGPSGLRVTFEIPNRR